MKAAEVTGIPAHGALWLQEFITQLPTVEKMVKNNFPGLFIAFEGIDGAGSSTQVSLVGDVLKHQGLKVLETKNPTNNVIGGIIRGVLTGQVRLPADALQLLYSADRAHYLDREVIPALKEGYIVLSDRYFFSTIAFGALDLDRNWLMQLQSKFLLPDLVVLVNVPAKVSIKRIKSSRRETEFFEKEEKLIKVAQNYLSLANEFKGITAVFDGTLSKEEVTRQIIEEIKKNSKLKKLVGKGKNR